MKPLRIATFVAALLTCLAIALWPPVLYGGGRAPGHGFTSLILLGLCAGVVFGSGILKRTPRPVQYCCAAAAWAAVAAVTYLSVR